jgi:hypothetical protein
MARYRRGSSTAKCLTVCLLNSCARAALTRLRLMRSAPHFVAPLLLAGVALSASACDRGPADAARVPPIVGTWIVQDPNAPFPYHMYVFNADGTMQQANPDAGDSRTSDSDGKGAWRARGDRIEGKWVEVLADRTTHQFAGRLEITFRATITGDSLTAFETAKVFDATGASAPALATPKPLRGARITLP